VRTPDGYKTGQFGRLADAELKEQKIRLLEPKVANTPRRSPLQAQACGFQEPENASIGYAWSRYLIYISDRNRTWKGDHGRYRTHIGPRLAGRPMAEVMPQDVLDCLPAGRTPATRHRVLALLKRLFNWSIKMGLYSGPNPCLKVDPPRYDNSRHRYLSAAEKEALLTALEADKNDFAKRMIKFLWLTGRRRGEVLALEWRDVNLEGKLVTFRKTKNGKVQTVPISSAALGILESCPRLSRLVFPCSSGEFFHSFNRSWVRIKNKAGLEDFRLHDLRHTFASILASSGKVDIYTLQRLLGHSQITMTQRPPHARSSPGSCRGDEPVA